MARPTEVFGNSTPPRLAAAVARCPACAGTVSTAAKVCLHCGHPLAPGDGLVTHHTSNAIAAVASFFIPGLGQLIQGRVLAGILFFVGSLGMWLVFLGFIVHIIAAVECTSHRVKKS